MISMQSKNPLNQLLVLLLKVHNTSVKNFRLQ